jgi:hypothetical protein
MLLKTADRYFSEYIRRSHADNRGYVKCCTCQKIGHWKEFDCGHYVNRKHKSLRFCEKNVAPQCRHCNRFDEGNKEMFTVYLVEKYGADIIQWLLIKKQNRCKMGKVEIDIIGNEYREKLKRLRGA